MTHADHWHLAAKTGRSSQPTPGCECLGCAHGHPAVSPWGCPSRQCRAGRCSPNTLGFWGHARAPFLHGCARCKCVSALCMVQMCVCGGLSAQQLPQSHLCRLLAVALLPFDLGFFHRKKILQKRHICVGDSAQTQTTTAERGRECEVETEPDASSTQVGSWRGAAGAMGMCRGRIRSWGGEFIPLASGGELSIHPSLERAAGWEQHRAGRTFKLTCRFLP